MGVSQTDSQASKEMTPAALEGYMELHLLS